MRSVVVILLLFALVDLLACGVLLVVVWAEHRRQRRLARDRGEVVPPATGQFVLLGSIALLGIIALYSALAYLLEA